jgi:hypothetical protein
MGYPYVIGTIKNAAYSRLRLIFIPSRSIAILGSIFYTIAVYPSSFAGNVPFSIWSSHRSRQDAGQSDMYARKN